MSDRQPSPPVATLPSIRTAAYAAQAVSVAIHILDLAKTLAGTTPTPRGSPYFGLDSLEPPSVPLLEELTACGIFRKYEFVLELGSELGSIARWLALSRGCRVLGTASTAAAATAARLLTEGASLRQQVETVAATPGFLPLRARTFTHVLSLETWSHGPDVTAVLREAYRTLRPGGSLLAQATVLSQPDTSPPQQDVWEVDHAGVPVNFPDDSHWYAATARDHIDALRMAGFVDIRARDVTDLHGEASVTWQTASGKLTSRIAAEQGSDCPYLLALREAAMIAEARRRGLLSTYHFLAKRPASERTAVGHPS